MMAFGGFDRAKTAAPVAEINLIPLIDVMLVLLVIFIMTAAMLTHAIKVELPAAKAAPATDATAIIDIAIDRTGQLYWGKTPIDSRQLPARLQNAAAQQPPPVVRIWADAELPYRQLAAVMASAKASGLVKIALMTRPTP